MRVCANTHSLKHGPPHALILVGLLFTLQTPIACWKNRMDLAEAVSRVLASVFAGITRLVSPFVSLLCPPAPVCPHATC